MPLVPCHFDLPISSYGLLLKVPFCWLLKMTYNVEIDHFLWAFLGLGMWIWVLGNVIPFKMRIGWDFSDEPRKSYAMVNLQLTFQLSKYGNFCILRLFEPSFENHDKALIKWCLWLQNKMLTKIFDFWLPNDHFAPTVDCSAI